MFLQADHFFDGSQKDDELWIAYLEGQQKALEKIFLRYYTQLYRYGIKLVRNENAVQDSIQELFLNLWEKRTKISKVHSVEFYLLYSLRRILLRQKEQKISIHRRNGEYIEGVSGSFQSAEERIIFKEEESERYQFFLKAREHLTDRQKEVLYLRLQHGLTNKEIAEILNVSLQRVKNCIYEATKQLREQVYQFICEKQV